MKMSRDLTNRSKPALLQEIEALRRKLAHRDQLVTECRIAREHLDERLRFEQLLADLSATFVNLAAADMETKIEQGLQQIVKFLDVDRSTFLQFSEDQALFSTVASYAKPGFNTFPAIRAHEEFPWAVEQLKRGEPVCWATLDDLPDEANVDKQSFQRYDLRANANIPISCEGAIRFTLSVGSMRRARSWPATLMPRLRLLGEIFANALLRKHQEEKLVQLRKQLQADNVYLQEEIKTTYNFEQILGQSEVLHYALYRVKQVAATDTPVLIQGETGTGKELVARAIHHTSLRQTRPLMKVDCATLPANLIESELFGHEKGAFTGAAADRKGRFELAHGATLFLDEIGELPLDVQPKLLRGLESGEFERLGSSHTR
jgi:transcriptional regulator with GAF, ATPase, and Fis domain